ncbi:porin family protein [Paraburkholderia elongata]|uniref:Porin n=1 Tax=Paraburkholderia elongata TaxID=2675747 RepID=A0A972NZS4_9BURK|nr:hypothetical protein [Paraburkholderia elongata]NPT61927.1 hypothetical protein [Paraburkholderia elongata]
MKKASVDLLFGALFSATFFALGNPTILAASPQPSRNLPPYQDGHSNLRTDDGINRPTLPGFRGAEGLGGAIYYFRPDWSVGGAYMYMKGNDVLNNNHAHQISAVLDHTLSRRTSAYLMSVYPRTNAGAQARINGINDPNGSRAVREH